MDNEAIRLRESASRLGQTLIWHCKNSPLETWQAAIDAGGKLDYWPGSLFHALYKNRPKRNATAQEIGEIAHRLEAMHGIVPLDRLREISNDPDWALFNLPQVDVI